MDGYGKRAAEDASTEGPLSKNIENYVRFLSFYSNKKICH